MSWRVDLVPESQLKDMLSITGLRQMDRALLILGARDPAPMRVKEIRALGKAHGLKAAGTFNASGFLAGSSGLATSTPAGWELTRSGRDRVAHLLREHGAMTSPVVVSTLRHHAATLTSPAIRSFVHEAVICFETNQLRAAVVLSWIGAVAVLQEEVIAHYIDEFNKEAARRDARWKPARSPSDLARLKEYDLLQVIAAIGMIGKDVKQELEACLKLRNSCGHPNALKIGESRVASHIETLILNVFQRSQQSS